MIGLLDLLLKENAKRKKENKNYLIVLVGYETKANQGDSNVSLFAFYSDSFSGSMKMANRTWSNSDPF